MGKFRIITLLIILLLTACQNNDESSKNSKENEHKQHEVDEKDSPQEDFYEDESNDSEGIEPEEQENQNDETDKEDSNKQDENNNGEQQPNVDEVITISNPTDIHLVVNKQRKLPDGFVPPDLVVPNVPFSFSEWNEKKQMRQIAATALEELFTGAGKEGIELVAVSGYRSYGRQEVIYNYNVDTQGLEHAQKYSAMPGHSEHQTGLTMDVSSVSAAFSLEESFRQTAEGEWLEKNAHHYGFIIRYPKGKEHITGYSYEPWHIRFVGVDVATEIFEQQITLEEYYGLNE